MLRSLLLAIVLGAIAPACGAAQGINLSLGDCGVHGARSTGANCTTNDGVAMTLVASVIPYEDIPRLVAVEGTIDAFRETYPDPMSPWWQMASGECRSDAAARSADFTAGPPHCADFWQGEALTAMNVTPHTAAPWETRFTVAVALPAERPMRADGSEYGLFKLQILRRRSVGAGACEGCSERVRLRLARVKFYQQPPDQDYVYDWWADAGEVLYDGSIVPALNRTWGQIKAAYR